jgi:hypothetical protein
MATLGALRPSHPSQETNSHEGRRTQGARRRDQVVFEEWKTTHAERVAEIKKFGEATAETSAKFDALDARIDELDVRMQKGRLDTESELDRDRSPR